MKTENGKAAENKENPKQQASADSGKPDSKSAKSATNKIKWDDMPLPVLVEFTFTMSAIFLILLFLTIVGLSWLTNTKLLDIAIRASVGTLGMGGLLMLITRQISSGVLEANLKSDEKPEQNQSEKPEGLESRSTTEAR